MRITGGEWASRRLTGPPRGSAIRPTPDFLREQGFAILAPHLVGATFLDLFAGSGAITCEALSRGVQRVFAAERNRRALTIIRQNLNSLEGATPRCELLALDVHRALSVLAQRGVRCGVAWCDPPFAGFGDGIAALEKARLAGVLAPGALVVLETPPRQEVAVQGFAVVRALRGAVLLSLSGDILSSC